MKTVTQKPCDQCPWRLANQHKRHAFGFYTKANLLRMWNQIRRGGQGQSCHMTDPTHPDHVAVGAKVGATPRECPGSIIVVKREARMMVDKGNVITDVSLKAYWLARGKRAFTKSGFAYWVVQRILHGHVPLIGCGPLPEVDVDDAEIGLPEELR